MTIRIKDDDCIFCKIVEGIIPSYKIYEDTEVLAFLTIGPINSGHTLIIPKNHLPNFTDLDQKLNSHIFNIAQIIAKKIEKTLKPKKVGLLIAGWDVPHTHLHVVPMENYHDLTSQKTLENSMPKFTHEEFLNIKNILKLD